MDKGRRDFLTAASAGAAASLSAFGLGGALAATSRSEKPLKAAFSNGGLKSSWCAQGKAAAEYWGKIFNVEVSWFDGELDAAKQRAAIERMATQKWDFVAISAHAVGSITEPVRRMIEADIPVITMDTDIASAGEIVPYAHIGANNLVMGTAVTQALVTKLGGRGRLIMTQGPLNHTGAQDRTKGFEAVVKGYPEIEVLETQAADWDVVKVARQWEGYLNKYPQIDAAFFHSDDMALTAYEVMKAQGRTSILIGGIDAMPPAIDAVYEGRMFASMRNPAALIHGGAVIAGVSAVTGAGKAGTGIPSRIITDGALVTFENAAGMRWLQDQFMS